MNRYNYKLYITQAKLLLPKDELDAKIANAGKQINKFIFDMALAIIKLYEYVNGQSLPLKINKTRGSNVIMQYSHLMDIMHSNESFQKFLTDLPIQQMYELCETVNQMIDSSQKQTSFPKGDNRFTVHSKDVAEDEIELHPKASKRVRINMKESVDDAKEQDDENGDDDDVDDEDYNDEDFVADDDEQEDDELEKDDGKCKRSLEKIKILVKNQNVKNVLKVFSSLRSKVQKLKVDLNSMIEENTVLKGKIAFLESEKKIKKKEKK